MSTAAASAAIIRDVEWIIQQYADFCDPDTGIPYAPAACPRLYTPRRYVAALYQMFMLNQIAVYNARPSVTELVRCGNDLAQLHHCFQCLTCFVPPLLTVGTATGNTMPFIIIHNRLCALFRQYHTLYAGSIFASDTITWTAVMLARLPLFWGLPRQDPTATANALANGVPDPVVYVHHPMEEDMMQLRVIWKEAYANPFVQNLRRITDQWAKKPTPDEEHAMLLLALSTPTPTPTLKRSLEADATTAAAEGDGDYRPATKRARLWVGPPGKK